MYQEADLPRETKTEPIETLRLSHRTEVKLLPQILTQGLHPEGNTTNRRFYGFVTRLIDDYAPEENKAIGLLRANCVFAWHLAPVYLKPLGARDVTVRFEVDRSRAYIGDFNRSGEVVHGLDSVYTVAFQEELRKSGLPSLNAKARSQLERKLWQDLFKDEVEQEILSELPERFLGNRHAFLLSLQKKMRGYGKQVASIYWGAVIQFADFERHFRLDPGTGLWTRYGSSHYYGAPEVMVIGSITPEKIEVVQKSP